MTTLASLTVKLLGDSGNLIAAFETAEKRAQRFEKHAGGSLQAFAKVAAGAVATAGVVVAGGLGAAVTAATGFEKSLSAIKAVSGATAEEMKQLSSLALQLGKDTSFSASEAAAGIEELVKGGLSVADIMGGAAQASLNLAAAGGVSLADAAEIAANAMAMFNLTGADMGMVADQIAGAANASSLSVTDFKFSLSAVGAVASLAGQSFQDTATAIALMGASGIKGSDAGTSLKTMLMNLVPSTDKAASTMADLGLITADGANKFLDAAGNFRSLRDISGELSKALDGLSESEKTMALEAIFGSDAIRAASVMAKNGAAGFDAMAASMNKVTAESVAAERLNNFAGSLEQLKSALETAAITLGMAFMPALKQSADALIGVVNAATPLLEVIGQKLVAALDSAKGGAERVWEATLPVRDLFNSLSEVVRVWVLPALEDLAAFDFEEAFKGISDGASVALTLLKNAFTNLSEKIQGWLQEQVAKVDWFAVWDRATAIASGLGERLGTIDWTAAGTAIGDGLGKVLPEALDRALETMDGFAGKVADTLTSVLQQIDFVAIGTAIAPKALEFVLGIATALLDLTMWASVITEHWDKALELVLTIMFMPAKWASGIARFLGKIPLVGDILGWMVKSLNEVGGKILGAVGTLFKDLGEAFIKGFGGVFGSGGAGGLLPKIRELLTGIINGITDFGETFYLKALYFMERMGKAIAEHGPKQVVDGVKNLFRMVDEFLAGTIRTMAEHGSTIITALKDGIVRLGTAFRADFGTFFDDVVVGPLRLIVSTVRDVGSQIAQGMAQGIRNRIADVRKAAKELADAVPQEVKDLLQIKSPSRVMEALGENIGAGLALGIISKQGEVQEALSTLIAAEQLQVSVEVAVKAGDLSGAVEQLMAAGKTAEQALQEVARVHQQVMAEMTHTQEAAASAIASNLMSGLGKGTGDALAVARQSLEDFQKQQWIASLEAQIKLASAEINKALAAGLDPSLLVEQALPLFEAYRNAVGQTAATLEHLNAKAVERMQADTLATATEIANSALANQRAELDNNLGPAWTRVGQTLQQATAEYEAMTAAARQAVETHLALGAVSVGRQQQSIASSQAGISAGGSFGTLLEGGMSLTAIAEALQQALTTAGRTHRLDEDFMRSFQGVIQGELLREFGMEWFQQNIQPGRGQDVLSFLLSLLGGEAQDAGNFAHGGSFLVGGRGGTDANSVMFRATRGERVTVTPPGERSGAISASVTINNYGTIGVDGLERMIDEHIRDGIIRGKYRNIG